MAINLALDAHLIGQSILAFSTIGHDMTFPTTIPFSIQKSTDSVEAFDLHLFMVKCF